MCDRIGVFRARFGGDGVTHRMQEAGIPGCREANGLRKDCCVAGARNAMQALVPPGVFGNTQPRNSRRGHAHLRNFFLRRHTTHQIVDALIDCEGPILEWVVRPAGVRCEKSWKHGGQPP
jgi:hypothetical protein